SFYQYFEDKEDLYFYLLSEHAKKRRTEFTVSLKKHEGNIFGAMTDMFHSLLKEIDNESLRKFYRNVFLHMNYRTEKALLNSISCNNFDKQYVQMIPLINTDDLNVADDEELFHVIHMMTTILVQNLVRKFANELSNEEVMKDFSIQISLLKRGFLT